MTLGDDVPVTIEIFEAGTTTSIGYDIRPSTVDVDPSGVYTSNSDYTTTTFSTNRDISVSVGLLNDGEISGVAGNLLDGSNFTVRPGINLSIPMVSSAPGVASLPNGALGSISIPSGSRNGSVSVKP